MRIKISLLTLILFLLFTNVMYADEVATDHSVNFEIKGLTNGEDKFGYSVGGLVTITSSLTDREFRLYVSDTYAEAGTSLRANTYEDVGESFNLWVEGFEGQRIFKAGESVEIPVRVSYPKGLLSTHPVAFVLEDLSTGNLHYKVVELASIPKTVESIGVISDMGIFDEANNVFTANLTSLSDRIISGKLFATVHAEDGKIYESVKDTGELYRNDTLYYSFTFEDGVPAGFHQVEVRFVNEDVTMSYAFDLETEGLEAIKIEVPKDKTSISPWVIVSVSFLSCIFVLGIIILRRKSLGKSKAV